jgi:hypothetical protein
MYGFRPDSVEALTPKKYASTADRLSQGYKTAMAMTPKLRMYASEPSRQQRALGCKNTHTWALDLQCRVIKLTGGFHMLSYFDAPLGTKQMRVSRFGVAAPGDSVFAPIAGVYWPRGASASVRV